MHIVVANHIFYDFYTSPMRLNAGILYHIAGIISQGHHIDIIDFHTGKKSVKLDDRLKYLKKYLIADKTSFKFFNQYYLFGNLDIIEKNHDKIQKADLIIISSFAYCYFEGLKETVECFKKFTDAPIVVGGSGPSVDLEYYKKNLNADYIIEGSAEENLTNFITEYTDSSDNKTFKVENPDKLKPYIAFHNNTLIMKLTRGCPCKCTYCSIHLTDGYSFIKTEIDDIKSELSRYKEIKSKVKRLYFEDDNLSYDKRYFKSVIDLFHCRFPDALISCENGIDLMTLDEDMIDFMVKSNFHQFNLSIASVDSSILQGKKRSYTLEKYMAKLDKVIKYKKKIIIYLISGLKNDTKENILNTLFFLAALPVTIGLSPFYPVPNTEECKTLSNIEPVLSKGSSFYPWFDISTGEQITLFYFARFINAVKRYKRSDFLIDYENLQSKQPLSQKEIDIISIILSVTNKKFMVYDGKNFKVNENLDVDLSALFFDRLCGEGIVNDYDEMIDFFRVCN